MRITVISAREIDEELCRRWQTIQTGNPVLANPFFSYEYTRIVSTVRKDVYVGVIEVAGEIVGFFPFQKRTDFVAGPVGGKLSDYQGLIVSPGRDIPAKFIMNGCRLKAWHFDHLLAGQQTFERYHRRMAASPIIDISRGSDYYLKEKKESGSRHSVNLLRKARKFEREIGPLRLEAYSSSTAAFNQVVEWKRAQCRSTGGTDFLGWGWTTDMLEQIWHTRKEMFAGMLSVLYCEDNIVAAHFGMRSDSVFHWWLPTYNPQHSKYSPGGILLLKLIEALGGEGINHIDLGKGDDFYKFHFVTGGIQLAEGCAWLPSADGFFQKARYETSIFLRYSPLLQPLKTSLDTARGAIRKLVKNGGMARKVR